MLWPHAHGFQSWAMMPAADAIGLWNADVPSRLAIMLGAEGPGLTQAALDAATSQVRIPISEMVDSLNVGHAAAITFAVASQGGR